MLTIIVSALMFCFLLEQVVPGWRLPKVQTWPVRVLAINAVQLGVGLLAGGVAAYFIATFIFCRWHRWRHDHALLWRGFHQIHHSPQRLEVITSFYKHPVRCW